MLHSHKNNFLINLLPTVPSDWIRTIGSNGCRTQLFSVRSDSLEQIIWCERTTRHSAIQYKIHSISLRWLILTKGLPYTTWSLLTYHNATNLTKTTARLPVTHLTVARQYPCLTHTAGIGRGTVTAEGGEARLLALAVVPAGLSAARSCVRLTPRTWVITIKPSLHDKAITTR